MFVSVWMARHGTSWRNCTKSYYRRFIRKNYESGKLLISKETIENLVNSVALNFENSEQVTTRIDLDKDNNVIVYVNLTVSSEAVIKDLSANLQKEIKEKIKNATDLEVKEVNITVKRVVEKQEEIQTEGQAD